MLTIMCPNCRHRFPAPGCCEATKDQKESFQTACYYGGLLVPRGYTSGGGCFINAPTIVHGPAIIQSGIDQCSSPRIVTSDSVRSNKEDRCSLDKNGCHVTTTCDLTGGSVTITTPGIQSGGCLIQSTDSGILVQAPHIEIRPKLSGGGCLVQKKLSTEEDQENSIILDEENDFAVDRMLLVPPSGCQELPGNRRRVRTNESVDTSGIFEDKENREPRDFGKCCRNTRDSKESVIMDSGGVQIQVNATVQLPANLGQCTVNITATTNSSHQSCPSNPRNRNNFNGGGIVQPESSPVDLSSDSVNHERDGAPTTPVSWLMPCPWGFDAYLMDKDFTRLSEAKRLLQTCGWYHEGISWQQSESLLKNAPVGRWLMRDSSDSRYTFAVSVQTARGPTSVRVHYFLGRFRLDAEPRLALAMPLFDCPIKMLEYYVEYSKRMDEHRTEVWVDYSGQLYSQIYLTKPLVKEVRSLSHLARLVVNKNKLSTEHLPPLIKNYLAEYPYTL